MAFLRLNGWTIPISVATARRQWKRSGERSKRTVRGAVVDARRNLRRMWECEACFQNHEDAEALIHLLSGEGHFFDLLDGAQASTGLQPSAALIGGARFRPSVFGRGSSLGALTWAGSGLVARFEAQLGDEWTVMFSRLVNGAWVTGALRSDGVRYEAGLPSTTWAKFIIGFGVFIEVENGAVEIWDDEGNGQAIDDLVILPWRASASQLATWTASSAPRFGPLPLLRLDGEILEGADDVRAFGSTLVVGEVTGVDVIQKPALVPGIGWVNNAKIVRFMLGEVDEGFKQAQTYRANETAILPPGSPLMWFDGASIDGKGNATLAASSQIAAWVNKGSLGTAFNAVQATPANRPTFSERAVRQFANHRPGASFSSASLQYLRTPGVTPVKALPWVIAAVAVPEGTLSTRYVYDGASTITAQYRWRTTATTWTWTLTATTTYSGVVPVLNRCDASVLRAATPNSLVRINQGTEQSFAAGSSFNGVTIGGSNAVSPSFHWNGKILELLVWHGGTLPTTAEIFAYLESRYGSFPQG